MTPSQMCHLFAFLPSTNDFPNDTVLLLLECLCATCVRLWKDRVRWDPGCLWYWQCLSISPGLFTLHSFPCLEPSFSYTTAISERSAWEFFTVEGDIRQVRPSFRHRDMVLRYSGELVSQQWTRTPAYPLPENITMPPRLEDLATAADLPIELHDVILGFLSLGFCNGPGSPGFSDHRCKDRVGCIRNHVSCTRHELHQMVCVCRRWAYLLRQAIFKRITVYNRHNCRKLLTLLDGAQAEGGAAQSLSGDLDMDEQLRTPWIHNIPLRLLPKLRLRTEDAMLTLSGMKPFPRNQIVSSIHGSLPKRLPRCSSGIQQLIFSDVHFRTFEHLVQLVKEMPSLLSLTCTRVTWDAWSSRSGQIPAATSFLARDDPSEAVSYAMEGCTDDRAMHLFPVLLGRTRQDIIDQNDARALGIILLAWQGISLSRRERDEIILGPLTVYLTPRAGVRQRRRIRSIVFNMQDSAWLGYDWDTIDDQLNALSSLHIVALIHSSRESLLYYINAVLPYMSHLGASLTLRLAYLDGNGFIQVFLTGDGIQEAATNYIDQDVHLEQLLPVRPQPLQRTTPALVSDWKARQLELTDVHFKSFEHLLQLVRALRFLEVLRCKRVTWDTLTARVDGTLSPTSYLARDKPSHWVWFRAEDCTDNRAASWLAMLIGLTKEDTLDQKDLNTLWAIEAAWGSGRPCTAIRYRDEIAFAQFRVFLTPRAGIHQPRQVSNVVINTGGYWTDVLWCELDRQVENLHALHVILLVASSGDELFQLCYKHLPLVPRFFHHPKLMLTFNLEGTSGRAIHHKYIQLSLTDDGVQEIGAPVEGVFGWKAFL
ncbi:hypothetical protein NM688_g7683 [Phlebia brevispora]|uniref:Uncharacterized protein n=1 Tax=Phlebia brevispora TaxID=194682 RepID=A0ACC1S2J6_9APHY|nr:hypothetical protein NM688_g7683 [Phlebia brevispora]